MNQVGNVAEDGIDGAGKLINQGMNALSDIDMGGVGGAISSGAGKAFDAVSDLKLPDGLGTVGNLVGQGIDAMEHAKVFGVVGGALGVAGAAVMDALDADTMAHVGNAALKIIGTSAAVFPFLLPLQIALRDLAAAMQQANYNKASAQMLADRCNDCGKLAAEMAPKITACTQDEREQIRMLEGITSAVKETREFIEKFTKKGFMMKMMGAVKDNRNLTILDAKVSSALQTLSIRVNGAQMDLAVADSKKLDEMFVMMNKAMGGNPNATPSKMDPAMLAEIARKAGMETKEEIMSEMKGIGMKLEKIEKAVNAVMAKVDVIDKKLDKVDTKLDKKFNESAQRDEELRQIMLQSAAEAARRDRIALDLMMNLTGKGIDKKYSSLEETERMGKRALTTVETFGSHVRLIHSHGLGFDSVEKIDGEHGQKGTSGHNPQRARDGQNGRSAGQEGLDGDDGDDGDAGDEGHDGESGTNCPDFAVMISLEQVHEDSCRTYKIEHSGQGEKEVFHIKIHPDRDVIFVNAQGGAGGNG